MKAMRLERCERINPGAEPLCCKNIPAPTPGDDDVLLQVLTCGVCHTELDEIEGRAVPPQLPVTPGHQVVGRVTELGKNVQGLPLGSRVGVTWIFSACGDCFYCNGGRENLCRSFRATGRDNDGGYAEYMVAPAKFVFPIPASLNAAEAAPLLCAGAVGYRALRLTNLQNGQRLGLTGFGSSAQLVLKMTKARFPASEIFVFARAAEERRLAEDLGACWSGNILDRAPTGLDAIIDTTPAWLPVTQSLRNLAPGGRLVINVIRKEDEDKDSLLRLAYPEDLWLEKEIKSVANITRADVSDCLALAAENRFESEVYTYPLESANNALTDLKFKPVTKPRVLLISA